MSVPNGLGAGLVRTGSGCISLLCSPSAMIADAAALSVELADVEEDIATW